MVKRITQVLGILGIIALLTPFVLPFVILLPESYYTVMKLLGIALIIIYVLFNLEDLRRFFLKRSTRYGANTVLVFIIFTAIMISLNFLSSRNYRRFDLTKGKKFALSSQTLNVLKKLKKDIRFLCFFTFDDPEKGKFQDLLEGYRYHTHRIGYEFIDPDKKPNMAQKYEIVVYGTTVLDSAGRKNITITGTTEEALTNAIIKITKEERKVVYFLTGHEEPWIKDFEQGGYSEIKKAIENDGYKVKELLLLQEGKIPEDCSVLVVASPKKLLLEKEEELIREYIKKGGRTTFLIDPFVPEKIEKFLEKYGVKLDKNVIIDPFSRLFGGDFSMPVVDTYPYHDVTRNFNIPTAYPVARSISSIESFGIGYFDTLAQTGRGAWGETNFAEKEATFDEKEDKKGPLTVIVALTPREEEEKKTPEERKEEKTKQDKNEQKKTQMVVFGDSDFINNTYIEFPGNKDFFLNTINWLAQEKELIAIRPKETEGSGGIYLRRSQMNSIFITSIVSIPVVILLAGSVVWWKRRRL